MAYMQCFSTVTFLYVGNKRTEDNFFALRKQFCTLLFLGCYCQNKAASTSQALMQPKIQLQIQI